MQMSQSILTKGINIWSILYFILYLSVYYQTEEDGRVVIHGSTLPHHHPQFHFHLHLLAYNTLLLLNWLPHVLASLCFCHLATSLLPIHYPANIHIIRNICRVAVTEIFPSNVGVILHAKSSCMLVYMVRHCISHTHYQQHNTPPFQLLVLLSGQSEEVITHSHHW